MFAPNHHPAMKNVAPVRRELGIKTIFNILGPLTNPAGAPNILMGVFHPDLVGIQVRALQRLGAEHAVVVYGRDGMDEVSLGAATLVGELKNGEITEYEIHPEDFGMAMASNRALQGGNAGAVQSHAAGRAGQPAAAPAQRHRGAQRRCGAVCRQCRGPTSMSKRGIAAQAPRPSWPLNHGAAERPSSDGALRSLPCPNAPLVRLETAQTEP